MTNQWSVSVDEFIAITKALSDENRVRALLAMREGELCACQVIELLGLAPSTVSKHMDLLRRARLIEMRKEGRWHYFRLNRSARASPAVRRALRMTLDVLADEDVIVKDAETMCCVREKDPRELTAARCC